MAPPNFKNRTLWTGDNLDIMRGLNSKTVDLIYLDPPFNSNRDYAAPIGSAAAGAAFKDSWTLSDVDHAWHGEIAEANPGLYRVIDAAREAHGKGMQSYLIMMAMRLLEMKRLLNDSGSVYLHCDPTASHYLKMVMDAVFGHDAYKNEITWRKYGAPSTTYWIVFEGTIYAPSATDADNEMTDGSGWTIGDVGFTKTGLDWTDISGSSTIPVEIWAKELYNPLSVSQEVTSDPTNGTDSDTYGAGDVITFEVEFNEAVTVTGAPQLRFNITGPGDEFATYVSGSGSNTLVFAYTVLATDTDADGIFLDDHPLTYPDAAADTIVAADDNLPVIDNIAGQLLTLSGHKIDGTITN